MVQFTGNEQGEAMQNRQQEPVNGKKYGKKEYAKGQKKNQQKNV